MKIKTTTTKTETTEVETSLPAFTKIITFKTKIRLQGLIAIHIVLKVLAKLVTLKTLLQMVLNTLAKKNLLRLTKH